jgi:hypothetical protein
VGAEDAAMDEGAAIDARRRRGIMQDGGRENRERLTTTREITYKCPKCKGWISPSDQRFPIQRFMTYVKPAM